MRVRGVLVAGLALAAVSCSVGAGMPPAPVTTTAPGTTTTSSADGAPEDPARAIAAATGYLDAWASFDWTGAALMVVGPPPGFVDAHRAWAADLDIVTATFTVGESRPADDGAGVVVAFTAAVELAGAGAWEYEGSLPLVRAGSRWLVAWSPAVLHPSLTAGERLRLTRSWPARGSILAIDGRPIAAEEPVKIIGVVPERIEDLDALLVALEEAAGIDPEQARGEIRAPGVQPDWFVPVGSLPTADYPAVASALEGLPGVLVRDGTERRRLPSPFADHVVGFTGMMTAELLEALGPPYTAAGAVGRSGLELSLERQLAGAPNQQVERVDQYGRVAEVLAVFPGSPPATVATTLDIDVQTAVEAVIDGAPEPSAIVVLDVATGGIRGIASRPLTGFDRALAGLYPPGSAFKLVTAAALLAAGVTTDQTVECPGQVSVGGRPFTNAGGEALGRVSFTDAFAFSCNTTFAPLATTVLAEGELAAAADRFGFGTEPDLPLPAAAPSFPEPEDDAEVASAAIGQGRVLVSPLHLATVAAAVAGGGWRPASLLADGPAAPMPLDPQVATDLAGLMAAVVEYGTGTAAAVEGEDVRGKTGTAEYRVGGLIETHAWFVGYWEGYAFAVLVEGGGGGGRVAAPLAAALVSRLAGLDPGSGG